MNWWNELAVLGQIGIAALLGGVIGLERELARKPAGLRTHMLVAASAALMVTLGTILVRIFPDHPGLRIDPIRIIEAITVGVSFLGAGTIIQLREQERVEGLTTAASLLLTAGVGIAVALQQHVLAAGVTLLILIINWLLRYFERRLVERRAES